MAKKKLKKNLPPTEVDEFNIAFPEENRSYKLYSRHGQIIECETEDVDIQTWLISKGLR